MNCLNCGAPLSWTPGAAVLHCGFCRSHRPLHIAAELADRVAWLGTTSERTCPACENPLERAVLDKTPAEACPVCHGLLIADEAFALVIRERRANYNGADVIPTPLDPTRLAGGVDCPDCQRPMERHCYGGPGNQIIDTCSPCGLVWLDCGELAVIETAAGRRR
ncbi:MAG TPA: zf-TFIIB domain-containing protein [Planctomycetaceae bacterium]|nr:zf-TFIIB domain-containing protein [Planctomycetaceae bacterium]